MQLLLQAQGELNPEDADAALRNAAPVSIPNLHKHYMGELNNMKNILEALFTLEKLP